MPGAGVNNNCFSGIDHRISHYSNSNRRVRASCSLPFAYHLPIYDIIIGYYIYTIKICISIHIYIYIHMYYTYIYLFH